MAKTQIVRQSSFFSGQVDPIQFNRTSFPNYLTAAQSLKNCIVDTTGIVHKRHGSVIAKVLRESFSVPIGFNANDGKWYIGLFRDYALQIYGTFGNDFEQRLTTNIKDPFNIDYTYIDASLMIFNGGKESEGGTPPIKLKKVGDEFKLIPLNFKPLPARDFNDIDYNDSNLTVTSNTIKLCTPGFPFSEDWLGGSIIGLGNPPEYKVYGEGIIIKVDVSNDCTVFTLDIKHPFGSIRKGSDISIRKPMMSSKIGWPSKGIFFANRLWIAGLPGSEDWIATSNAYSPLAFHFYVRERDGFATQVPQVDRKESVYWLNAGRKLEVYTGQSVYTSEDTGIITPGNFQLFKRSSFGASKLFKPLTYQNDSYYISRTGNSLIKFQHDILSNDDKSINVTKASQTLVNNPFDRVLIIGTSSSQDNFITYLNKDKQLCNFQFSNEVGLAAVTPFKMEGEVLGITEVDNNIFLLKRLIETDTYTLEVMATDIQTPLNKHSNSFSEELSYDIFIDSASQNKILPDNKVVNLKFYEGYSVRAVTFDENGFLQDLGEYNVKDGAISIINYKGTNKNVIIGFTYDVEIIPMYFYLGPNNSTVVKTVSQVTVEYYNSLDFYIENELVKYQYFKDISNGVGLNYKNGFKEINLLKGHNRYSTFRIHQRSPFNLCITSINYKITGAYI